VSDVTGVAYDDVLVPEWSAEVDSWAWQEWRTDKGTQMGWYKVGECPACRHPMSHYQRIVYALTAPAGDSHMARCNCGKPHAGRPSEANVAGCGRHGNIQDAP
jgi:hypothetical protein